jgi:hypothetical protein
MRKKRNTENIKNGISEPEVEIGRRGFGRANGDNNPQNRKTSGQQAWGTNNKFV